MRGSLSATWNRAFALLGRVSMYRLVFLALAAIALVALVLSFFQLVVPDPGELLATLALLAVVIAAVDAAAQRIARLPWRIESSLITAFILLFVLRPTLEPLGLLGVALAGAAAAVSKYVLVWRGRHILNPAAFGAALLTVVSIGAPDLGASSWWVGTPALAAPVLIAGLVVLMRTEKVRVVLLFWVVATVVALIRTFVQYQSLGIDIDPGMIVSQVLWASPFLFLGAFMLSEPLTLPPRRWQQYVVALVVGILAGWPIPLGEITLGQERALLIGNLVAFALAVRVAVRLTLEARRPLGPTAVEATFRASRRFRFQPGQYLQLDVPHHRPDARGTRREFSLVSAPEDLPTVRIAFRDGGGGPQSTYKRALAATAPGDALPVTGVWGDFVLPRRADAPLLLVAAGIGITPFVSQLRHLRRSGERRDIVVVAVAPALDELPYRDELEAAGVPVVVATRAQPATLPAGWTWAGPGRLDAAGLERAVPDLSARRAFVSGPPALIADLAPALSRARSLTTDAFSGY
ncbi:flavodoxin reductase [Microbacterium sp. X-17]|uniref:FAD-dependent oxidoreductase n=1 Tax=Microbacterium sp. X-17 TaxID=3144404 RepID=UPI0031F4CE7E